MLLSDTICAICTPSGRGAIATLRLSGPNAIGIADSVFQSARKGKRLADQLAMTMHYGHIMDRAKDGDSACCEPIDDVVVGLFRAPHSFTGEDTVEITCHGSPLVQRRILQRLIDAGARMATAGEFTKRAFVNGKMDLCQAEAVADMIAAESDAARRVAYGQMRGGFSQRLSDLRLKLVEFASLLELELDFSEEDVEFADRTKLEALLADTLSVVTRLTDSFRLGNAIKVGIPTAIVGEPNAGKSTLLNALLCEERSIVSDIQGTTRDTVEETLAVGDLTFRLIDTAGLRSTTDVIEAEGVRRSLRAARQALVVVYVLDAAWGAARATDAIETLWNNIRSDAHEASVHDNNHDNNHVNNKDKHLDAKHLIVCVNKTDVASGYWANEAWAQSVGAEKIVPMAARNGEGIEDLKQALVDVVGLHGHTQADDVMVTNERHYEALRRAVDALTRVQEGLTLGTSGEFISLDLHEATDALASITGEVSSQEVLNRIFEKFCIGK